MKNNLSRFMRPLTPKYTAILKLYDLAWGQDLEVSLDRLYDGWIVTLFRNGHRVADAVQHCWSYGHEENLVEELGLMDEDDVVGCVTPEQVVTTWKEKLTSAD